MILLYEYLARIGVGVAMKAQVITLDTHGHWVAWVLRFGNRAFHCFLYQLESTFKRIKDIIYLTIPPVTSTVYLLAQHLPQCP